MVDTTRIELATKILQGFFAPEEHACPFEIGRSPYQVMIPMRWPAGGGFLLNYGRMIENCTQTTRAYETRPALILVVIQFKNGSQGETQTHMLNCVKVASYQSTFTWP